MNELSGFAEWGPVGQAGLATSVNWLLTTIGAAAVFAVVRVGRNLLNAMLGFAAGVMLAASFWSLLAPSIELSELQGSIRWMPPLIGFVVGCATLLYLDRAVHQLRPRMAVKAFSGTSHRALLLTSAITLHNIPEGLAVGVAFGAAATEGSGASVAGAMALSLGIGIQDLPEGMAVSLPLRADGMSPVRSFMYGQFSGLVEVFSGVVGAIAVIAVTSLLPYALSFAAGAMILVTLKELIPESMSGQQNHGIFGLVVGFSVMMVLDVALA